MIKKLWQKWFSDDATIEPQSIVLERSQHSVSRKDISVNALKVLNRLHKANYEAYLAGGGVRDLLLGLHPKDFDVATSATPEQVKQLFRNCRIIGRRFKLAHILFGHEIIEVATFRAHHDQGSPHGKQHESGMLVRDNVYGSLEEDALRRDFTINALYYSSSDFSLRDFTGGLQDLEKRQLRLIGDPLTRYKEDPVRMLRAVRLAVKLDLAIETKTAKPITTNANLLSNVSAARLWDESHKLLLAGHAEKTVAELINYRLFEHMLPGTYQSLQRDSNGQFRTLIDAALRNTDKRIQQEKPVTPAFLYAIFLWQPLKDRAAQLTEQGMSHNDAYHKAMSHVISEQSQYIAIPKRFALVMRDIWALQPRLEHRTHKSFRLLEHPKFRAAYDVLVLRAEANPNLQSVAQWWTRFQEAGPDGQRSMLNALSSGNKNRRKRRFKNNKHRGPKRNKVHTDS